MRFNPSAPGNRNSQVTSMLTALCTYQLRNSHLALHADTVYVQISYAPLELNYSLIIPCDRRCRILLKTVSYHSTLQSFPGLKSQVSRRNKIIFEWHVRSTFSILLPFTDPDPVSRYECEVEYSYKPFPW